ncbi:MAG: ATP-dependent metallopeptidase FtsH/Yme1/Tma family protein, partial [SAR86 cluster bacterium]
MNLLVRNNAETGEIPYSAFKQQVRDGNIQSIVIRGSEIRGVYRFPKAETDNRFSTMLPTIADAQLMTL